MLLLVNLGMFGSVAPVGDIYLGKERLSVVVASPQVPELLRSPSRLLCG